jgi:hypothetical protein
MLYCSLVLSPTPAAGRVRVIPELDIEHHCSPGVANAQPNDQGIATANPIFTWVRLAQRIPLRIELEAVAEGVVLVAGMTATVEVHARVRSCSPSLSLGAIRVTRRAAAPAEGDLLRPAPRTRTPPR